MSAYARLCRMLREMSAPPDGLIRPLGGAFAIGGRIVSQLPTALAVLQARDIQDRLSVLDRPLCRRARNAPISGATLHYNGPPVSAFGQPERELRHVIAIDVPNHQARLDADSLMYHFIVLSDGRTLQTRDLDLQAWHCGHKVGNEGHIAIHLPLGGTQDATAPQWRATCLLFESIILAYELPGRSAIKAHSEWKPTACPGPRLLPRLKAWRAGELHTPTFYRIRPDVPLANIRQGPGRTFPVALDGRAVLYPRDTVDADAIVEGEAIAGERRWAHLRTGVGFIHMSLLVAL